MLRNWTNKNRGDEATASPIASVKMKYSVMMKVYIETSSTEVAAARIDQNEGPCLDFKEMIQKITEGEYEWRLWSQGAEHRGNLREA